MAQDERYFRQIFSGELTHRDNLVEEKKYSYYIHTPFYSFDLNHDKRPEEIVFVKKDSEDWFEVYQESEGIRTKVFSYRFETKGYNSQLYKLEYRRLSAHTMVLLLYYFEGLTKYTEMQSSSRLYLVTIDNDDLKSMRAFKGPSFFEEYKSLKGHYHLRNYQIYLQDLNNDGTQELIVKHRDVGQIFFYEGNGKWKTFNN